MNPPCGHKDHYEAAATSEGCPYCDGSNRYESRNARMLRAMANTKNPSYYAGMAQANMDELSSTYIYGVEDNINAISRLICFLETNT